MSEVVDILEPSAGKGNIADYLKENYSSESSYGVRKSVDCIEIDPDLQLVLKGKGHRLIHDDFLTFQSHKRYDLIIANFPFSTGEHHLEHALAILERHGGHLICLVNAETIRNPHSKRRIAIKQTLSRLSANIEYLSDQFLDAERSAAVEIALIHIHIDRPSNRSSIILDALEQSESISDEITADDKLMPADFLTALIARFDLESRIGISLIQEYSKLKPFIMDKIKRPETYSNPILELKVQGMCGRDANDASINEYLSCLRHKYWEVLIRDPRSAIQYFLYIEYPEGLGRKTDRSSEL